MAQPNGKIGVLVVDDSALARQILTKMLSGADDIEVLGTAADALIARDKIKRLKPDVLTLDVEMPRMDGLRFLENLMRLRPMPVVMISTLTERGAEATFKALELGAVDFVAKPKSDLQNSFGDRAAEIVEKVRAAASARVRPLARARKAAGEPTCLPKPKRKNGDATASDFADRIIAVGASTGGTEAVQQLLCCLPSDCPAVLIAQHIPLNFSESLAQRLDKMCGMPVYHAMDGQPIRNGCAYVAPGDFHLMVARNGDGYICRLGNGAPVNRHRPSVDILFESIADQVGALAAGVILTGMGSDGALGMKAMHERGAYTVAQDERTSLIWGMPYEAIRREAVNEVLPLDDIAYRVVQAIQL